MLRIDHDLIPVVCDGAFEEPRNNTMTVYMTKVFRQKPFGRPPSNDALLFDPSLGLMSPVIA
jgi:hypothetical protein